MSKPIKIISKLELHKMNLGALMKRRLELLKCDESFEASDRFEHEGYKCQEGIIEYKNTPEWTQAYKELLDILALSEHYPNKAERKKIRQEKAQKRK